MAVHDDLPVIWRRAQSFMGKDHPGLRLQNLSTSERDLLGADGVNSPQPGHLIWNTTTQSAEVFDGSSWIDSTASAADILAKLLTVDGAGSGVDADLLDGKTTGTSGNTIPLLDGANTWSGAQTFSAAQTFNAASTFNAAAVFNEAGADVDFRVEGDTNTHMLFVDASADQLGIGTSSLHAGARVSVSGGVSFAATSVGLEADPASAYFGTFEAYASSEFVLTQSEAQAADESGGWRTALALYHNDGDATNYESLVYRTISDGMRVGVFGPNDGAGTYSANYKDLHGVTSQVIGRTDWTIRGVAAYTGDSVQFGGGVCLNELTMSNPSASNAQSSQIAGWYVTLSGKKAAADGSHTSHGFFVNNVGKKSTAAIEAISAGTDGDNGQYGYALKLDVSTVDTAAIYMPASASSDVGTRILYESGSWSAYDRTGNAFTWALGSANVVALDAQGLWPATDGSASLGYPTVAWQNLYINTGGTLNFEDGDVIITHSANTLTVSGGTLATAALTATTINASGAITPTAGVAAAGGFSATPRNMHTGGNPATAAADGTNLDIVVTELYVAEVFVPANVTVTGVAYFAGANTNGNQKVMLFNSSGTRVAISASTSVAADVADAYTRIAFTGTYAAVGPATYYVGIICDDNTHDINTHVVGSFGAGKITGLVYATESGYATITPPSTFTTGLGPIASLY